MSAKLNENELINWLQLARTENIGPKTFIRLISACGSAGLAIQKVENISDNRNSRIKLCSRHDAEKELESCHKIGARIIASCEDDYPDLLEEITDKPPVITVLGNTEILKRDAISIVGTRNASANGLRFTGKIASDLGKKGYIIVSGMARGIDTAAHNASLMNGTIAVLAGGINHIYPPENEKLYKSIAEKGAIIAESAFNIVPRAESFPRRNRIISGLSLGTVVVEAAGRSGSLITARFAAEQNREVMAIPGFPMDPRAEGPNKLIKQGATLVENADDIIEAVRFSSNKQKSNLLLENETEDFLPENVGMPYTDIDDYRERILSNLGSGPTDIDYLINQTNMQVSAMLDILLELEIEGRITRHPGNKVSLLVE